MDKEIQLSSYLSGLGSLAVAFSGGVDSSYLAAVCAKSRPLGTTLVTGCSASFPQRELTAAKELAQKLNLRHILVDSEELGLPGFSDNPPNRCYICKRELFGKIMRVAAEEGLAHVAEASNLDDEGDYRPGLAAIAELGVLSPLRKVGLQKEEIRLLSKRMGLSTWDKPSFACLASRFPYGEQISAERLAIIDQAESHLLELGLKQVRVRFHEKGKMARIEADEESLARLFQPDIRRSVAEKFQSLGFVYTTVDLQGYRTGSMNLTLPMAARDSQKAS
jgi:uncharacterized protein